MSEALCRHCDSNLPGHLCPCPGGTQPRQPKARQAAELHLLYNAATSDLLKEALPYAMHGVSLAIASGGIRGDDTQALEKLLAKLADWMNKA